MYSQNLGFFVQENVLKDPNAKARRYGRKINYRDINRVGEEIYKETLEITASKNDWIKSELDLIDVFKGKENTVFMVDLTFSNKDLTGDCTNSLEELNDQYLYFADSGWYDNPCGNGYYYRNGSLSKLLISTNVGLMMKESDDGYHVNAIDLVNATPISGISLGMYNYQNRLLQIEETDLSGAVHFTEKGHYIFGETPEGIAILRSDHPSWNLSSFDVGGRSQRKSGMDVFLYTDRGVHRPGDIIQLAGIARMRSNSPPTDMPAVLKLYNPKNQLVKETRITCGNNGVFHFPINTKSSDLTGEWRATINIAGETFTKQLKVETVKPVRLKTSISIPEVFKYPVRRITAKVESKYLFGTPAMNLKMKAQVTLRGMNFQPEGLKDYSFTNPMKSFKIRELDMFSGRLDSLGRANIKYNLPDLKTSPAAVQVMMKTTVYEKGGNFQESRALSAIYPYEHYAGFKRIITSSYVKRNEQYKIPVILVDPEGNPIPNKKIRVKVYVNRRHWWWHYDRRDRQDFRQLSSTYVISDKNYISINGPIEYELTVEDWGKHYFEVIDVSSGHSAGFYFWASNWGRVPTGEDDDSEHHLALSLNREVYQPGDEINVSFDAPDSGMAFLSIEQGNTILHSEWKPVSSPRTSFTFEATDQMLPNCYVSISLIQPHSHNTNDMPMRMYGVSPVFVEKASSRLALEMSVPEEIKPLEDYSVTVTSRAKTQATYTIAIVDEGLLSLTGFKTPDPWAHFFERLRLAVRTTDNLSDVLGALFPDIDNYFSIGGDAFDAERIKRMDKDKDNRFKPVAFFKGPIDIDPGKSQQLTFTMPNYVGEVRIMLIGASENSYTNIEEFVPVRQPLMLLSTLPRIIRPMDQFELPVSVFVMDTTIKEVDIELNVSSNLEVMGGNKRQLSFTGLGEKDVSFILSVGETIGTDTVIVNVNSGEYTSTSTTFLPVSTPNPFITEVTEKTLQEGKSITFIPEKVGIAGSNHVKLAISRVPDIQLENRLKYLIRYPYGCIEQITSSVFSQLYLSYLLDLNPEQEAAITDAINSGIEQLSEFKIREGFSYWPGSERYSEWGSNYAGHFLLEAKNLGYHVPDHLLSHWKKTTNRKAREVEKDKYRFSAYRLFLLALAGDPNSGGMNLMRENHLDKLDYLSKKLLATAYYLSGDRDVARKIDRHMGKISEERELGRTWGSPIRDMSLIAYLYLKMNNLEEATELIQEVTKRFNPLGWYSTHETAMTLLTIGKFYQSTGFPGGSTEFELKLGDGTPQVMNLESYQTSIDLDAYWDREVTITSLSKNPLFLSLFEEGIPLDDRVKTEYEGIKLERHFFDEYGNPTQVSTLNQGKPFWLVYKVASQNGRPLDEVALTSILPSGWEIINLRVTGEEPPSWVQKLKISNGEYMDIRDDRINWFFDLKGIRPTTFAVKINPTFKGIYRLPPVSVETMYSPEFYARISSDRVTVQ